MPIRRCTARALAAVASFVGLNCAEAPPGRYALEVDPGARLRTVLRALLLAIDR